MVKKILTSAIIAFLLAGCGSSGGGGSGSATESQTPQEEVPGLETGGEVAGTDGNANGVRDDIDDYITQHYSNDQQKNALLQFAKVMQDSLVVDTSDTAAVQAIDGRDSRALHCVFVAFGDPSSENPSTAWHKIRSLTTNTKDRLEAYLKFNHALDGTTSTLSEGDTCGDANPTSVNKDLVIAFFNGIVTTKQDGKDDVEYLKSFYGATTGSGKNIGYELVYNDSLAFYQDVINLFEGWAGEGNYELFFDKLNGSDSWSTAFSLAAAAWLGAVTTKASKDILSLLDNPPRNISDTHKTKISGWLNGGKKVVFVAQSHGNIFANIAYDYANSPSVKVVHVAPVSVETRGAHVLAEQDLIVGAIKVSLFFSGKSLPASTQDIPEYKNRPAGANDKKDISGHGFIEIYINTALDISSSVRARINEAISSLSL
jgi:hypothetical protein